MFEIVPFLVPFFFFLMCVWGERTPSKSSGGVYSVMELNLAAELVCV